MKAYWLCALLSLPTVFALANFASSELGARVLAASPDIDGRNSILQRSLDRYAKFPCAAGPQYLIVELTEDASLSDIQIISAEFYSGRIANFSVSLSKEMSRDPNATVWGEKFEFSAENSRAKQTFKLPPEAPIARYLLLNWDSSFVTDRVCSMTTLIARGVSAIQVLEAELEEGLKAATEWKQAAEEVDSIPTEPITVVDSIYISLLEDDRRVCPKNTEVVTMAIPLPGATEPDPDSVCGGIIASLSPQQCPAVARRTPSSATATSPLAALAARLSELELSRLTASRAAEEARRATNFTVSALSARVRDIEQELATLQTEYDDLVGLVTSLISAGDVASERAGQAVRIAKETRDDVETTSSLFFVGLVVCVSFAFIVYGSKLVSLRDEVRGQVASQYGSPAISASGLPSLIEPDVAVGAETASSCEVAPIGDTDDVNRDLIDTAVSRACHFGLLDSISVEKREISHVSRADAGETSIIESDSEDVTFSVMVSTQIQKKAENGTKHPFASPTAPLAVLQLPLHGCNIFLNRFPLLRSHFLVTSKDFVLQTEKLTPRFLRCVHRLRRNVDGIAAYNCGEHSGASQQHRHAHVVCVERFPLLTLLEEAEAEVRPDVGALWQIPTLIDKGICHAVVKYADVVAAYDLLFSFAQHRSHNWILTDRYMVLFVRSLGEYHGVSVNALSLTGVFFARDEEAARTVENAGGFRIMKGVCEAML